MLRTTFVPGSPAMTPVFRSALVAVCSMATLCPGVPARAADLPFFRGPPPVYGAQGGGETGFGGGGFRVARVPVRPAPLRYDIYGYPLFPGVPSPLAVGNGCPPAIQPDYDAEGNFAGYAPIPMCH